MLVEGRLEDMSLLVTCEAAVLTELASGVALVESTVVLSLGPSFEVASPSFGSFFLATGGNIPAISISSNMPSNAVYTVRFEETEKDESSQVLHVVFIDGNSQANCNSNNSFKN